jgi:Tfp pilus assembly protein PilF
VALRDPVDDVRLLAYALLDSKERAIYGKIRAQTARLAEAVKEAQGGIHKRLAQEHWELVYLGLATGEVRAHVLESGLRHARQALSMLRRDAGLHLLLGRMLCAQGHYDEGAATFNTAETLGLPSQSLASFRAEIAFRRREYDRVRELLRELPAESKRRMPMAAVVAYWGAQ